MHFWGLNFIAFSLCQNYLTQVQQADPIHLPYIPIHLNVRNIPAQLDNTPTFTLTIVNLSFSGCKQNLLIVV
jgi:hypothetical protein